MIQYVSNTYTKIYLIIYEHLFITSILVIIFAQMVIIIPKYYSYKIYNHIKLIFGIY